MMTSVCMLLLNKLHRRAFGAGILYMAEVTITFGKEVLPSSGSLAYIVHGANRKRFLEA